MLVPLEAALERNCAGIRLGMRRYEHSVGFAQARCRSFAGAQVNTNSANLTYPIN